MTTTPDARTALAAAIEGLPEAAEEGLTYERAVSLAAERDALREQLAASERRVKRLVDIEAAARKLVNLGFATGRISLGAFTDLRVALYQLPAAKEG